MALLRGASLVSIPMEVTRLSIDLTVFAISAGVIMTPVYILVSRVIPARSLNFGYGIGMTAMMIGVRPVLILPDSVSIIGGTFLPAS